MIKPTPEELERDWTLMERLRLEGINPEAAPDMLEALKRIFKLIDERKIGRDTSRDHDPDWVLGAMDVVVGLKLAKDAIAKAEGRDS